MTDDNGDWINDAGTQQREFDTLPADIYRVRAKVKPGGVVDPLCVAKNGYTEHLKIENTVIEGPYKGAKIFDYVTLRYSQGGDDPDVPALTAQQIDNYETAVEIGRVRLRAIVDSAHGLRHKDDSDQAKATRRAIAQDLLRVSGLTYWAHVDIEKGRNGYKDSNRIDRIVTVDDDDWPGKKAQRGLALLWQIYSGRRSLQIHVRQCGHRCGGSRAKSSRMAWRTAGKVG